MELEEISSKLVYKVFGKKEIDFRESKLFRTHYSITPRGDDLHSFINIECLNPEKFEGVPHFLFRARFYYPEEFIRARVEDTIPLNLKDALKYLKRVKQDLFKYRS